MLWNVLVPFSFSKNSPLGVQAHRQSERAESCVQPTHICLAARNHKNYVAFVVDNGGQRCRFLIVIQVIRGRQGQVSWGVVAEKIIIVQIVVVRQLIVVQIVVVFLPLVLGELLRSFCAQQEHVGISVHIKQERPSCAQQVDEVGPGHAAPQIRHAEHPLFGIGWHT